MWLTFLSLLCCAPATVALVLLCSGPAPVAAGCVGCMVAWTRTPMHTLLAGRLARCFLPPTPSVVDGHWEGSLEDDCMGWGFVQEVEMADVEEGMGAMGVF